MAKKLVGKGILSWEGNERRSGRYGTIQLCSKNFRDDAASEVILDEAAIREMKGHVRLTCRVTSARESGHIGDLFLGIKPSQPDVGEEIEVGVGHVELFDCEWGEPVPGILLKPEDGRETNWIDPRVLYRLHDQTVELFAEETDDPCHADPGLFPIREAGMKSAGGGFYQARNVDLDNVDKVLPKVTKLGDGMFRTGPPGVGEDVEITTKK